MSPEDKLKVLGYAIEPVELDNGKIVHAVRTGNLVFTSGHVSFWRDTILKGQVGQDLSVDEAYEGAKYCTLNNLEAIKTVIGSLDNVVRIVKVLGMVNVAPGFVDTPAVIHGCSDFLREIFGEAGHHARSAVGMTIPENFAVEVEMVVEVR